MYKRFKFIMPFTDRGETIPVGSELTILGDRIYFNGGQIMPGLYQLFMGLIQSELRKPHYLKEVPVPYNKV